MFKESFISLIFCAGGKGTRMGSPIPKQFLSLGGKPIALHSFDLFANSSEIDEIIVVCEKNYQSLFKCPGKPVIFAEPGQRRQDSVYSGLLKTSPEAALILTHDSARPFLEKKFLLSLLESALTTGAAALGAPAVCTIKQCDKDQKVEKTLDRSLLWEMQSPQALRRSLFFKAFDHALKENIEVTDDTALAEAIGHAAVVVPSSPRNFKITTPFDLKVAETLCATN